MKVVRIFQSGLFLPGDTVQLSHESAHHVARVLKMSVGDAITLFNGQNHESRGEISSIDKKNVSVCIESSAEVSRESPKPIHLAQCLSKGERMEWVIQKSVELGIASITPVISERVVVRLDAKRMEKKQKQWEAIAIAACEQCGRNQIPIIYPPTSFENYLQQCQAVIKLILEPNSRHNWRAFDFSAKDIALLIGPEGGFSQNEVALARKHAFQALCLGPRVLRTETAAIAAISILQAVIGDL